jgi:transcription-repair coupling factor (superfamily II helicase)
MKNGVFPGYFPGNPQDKFYQTDKFRHIINYLTQNPAEAQLKEKTGKEGNQLMMRKDKVRNVDEVNSLLKSMLKTN